MHLDDLPIIQYWNTAKVPSDIAALLAAVAEQNPGRRHLLFDRESAERLIAEHFTAREVAAFRACAVPAMQSDYFRYCAVLALGGIYVDADLQCFAPLHPLTELEAEGRVFQRANEIRVRLWPYPYPTVVNAVFAFRSPGHPLLRLALDVATVNVERRTVTNVWAATGPGIFTSLFLLHTLGSRDEFVEVSAGDWVSLTAEVIFEIVGEPGRASEVFEGVDVEPVHVVERCVRVERKLSYKSGDDHWLNWGADVFR